MSLIIMKKTSIGPLITSIILVLVAALFIFVFVSLNRLDKKIIAVQQEIIDNSGNVASIVNFINATTNDQTSN
ncbi:hypothetical protein GX917_01400 [Candidatus Falkowbacteria bacterium]|jgi:chromosome condensin MukBEF MukE localization factor|nr:hypothetical protein [Candidatus Falkowbacteria bacterium]